MSEEDVTAYLGEVVLDELPGEYEVPGFIEHYTEYLDNRVQECKAQQGFSIIAANVITIVGGLIAIVGLATLIFGPSTIYYTRGAMTLSDFIQLYPGPILSVGVLLFSVGGALSNQSKCPFLVPEDYLLEKWRIRMADGTECDKTLVITWQEASGFHIDFAPAPEQQTSPG